MIIVNKDKSEVKEKNCDVDYSDEVYIGGIESFHLRKGQFGQLGQFSYGVYATNKRIIGTKSTDVGTKAHMVGLLGGGLGLALYEKTIKDLKDDSVKTIDELERNKDFEVRKEDILQIEWKKVSLWDGGRLTIQTKSKQEFIIGGDGKQEFEYLLSLMQKFYSEVLKIK